MRELIIKKAECQRINVFELWCWRRLLRITARRSNWSTCKKISPEYLLEVAVHGIAKSRTWLNNWTEMNWCWSWNSNSLATWCKELTHLKRPWCWESLGQEKGMTEDEMVWWHHWLYGQEFEQALAVGDGQESVAWGYKQSDRTEQLN